jgi:mRNA-degrading endonuclease toxin of MazEF toxin-antitoxin module
VVTYKQEDAALDQQMNVDYDVVRDIPSELFLTPEDGLLTNCAANMDNIQTVSKRKVGPLIAHLSQEKMAEVNRAIAFALGLDVPALWR